MNMVQLGAYSLVAEHGSAGRDQALDNLGQRVVGLMVWNLASSSSLMSPAAILKHQVTNVGFAGAVEDRFSDGENRILLLKPPHDVDGDVGFGVKGIDHESIDRINGLFGAQVQHNDVIGLGGAADDLILGGGFMLEEKLDTLVDIGQLEDRFDIVAKLAAITDQIHHQSIVADAEIAKTAEAGARVHEKVKQVPTSGV